MFWHQPISLFWPWFAIMYALFCSDRQGRYHYQNHSGSLQNVVHEEPLLYYKSILKLSGVRNRDIIRSR